MKIRIKGLSRYNAVAFKIADVEQQVVIAGCNDHGFPTFRVVVNGPSPTFGLSADMTAKQLERALIDGFLVVTEGIAMTEQLVALDIAERLI